MPRHLWIKKPSVSVVQTQLRKSKRYQVFVGILGFELGSCEFQRAHRDSFPAIRVSCEQPSSSLLNLSNTAMNATDLAAFKSTLPESIPILREALDEIQHSVQHLGGRPEHFTFRTIYSGDSGV